jgi:predicted aldo/keto reductase-like oxidoreductase
MSCPSGVNILECLEMYNTVCMFDAPEVAKISYNIVLGMLTRNPEFTSQFQELVCAR